MFLTIEDPKEFYLLVCGFSLLLLTILKFLMFLKIEDPRELLFTSMWVFSIAIYYIKNF